MEEIIHLESRGTDDGEARLLLCLFEGLEQSLHFTEYLLHTLTSVDAVDLAHLKRKCMYVFIYIYI
jgi:hypothetical protein